MCLSVFLSVCFSKVCLCFCLHVFQLFYKPLEAEDVLTEEELNVMFINWKELRLSSMKLMK